MFVTILIFMACGAVAGVLAGLLGVGGGIVIVPMLDVVFTQLGYDHNVIHQLALGTSLASIMVTSISSSRAHAKRGAVHFDILKNITPGILIGTFLGGLVATSFVGIGGGTLSVPFMTFCNVPIHHAVGTSAAIGFPIAVAGTIGYIVGGWGTPTLPSGCLGFVHLLAFAGIACVSFFTAPLGARLSHALPTSRLKKGFACFLILVAVRMLWNLF